MNPVRGLLFDMDGVIVDSIPFHMQAWRSLFEDLGLKFNQHEFLSTTSGMPTHKILPFHLKREIPAEESALLCAKKDALYYQLHRTRLQPVAGLEKFLSTCRAQGLRLGVGTGANHVGIDFALDGLGLRDRFDAIVGSDDVKHGKPDPETFLTLAKRLGVEPKDCVVFEDALLGETAARQAGMRFVAVTTSHRADEFQAPDLAISDFSSLTVSDVLALF